MGINECSRGEEAWQQDEQPGLFAFLPTDRYISPFLIRHGNAVPPSPPGEGTASRGVPETEGLQKQQIVNLRFYRIFTRLFDFPAGMGFGKFRTELWKTFLKGS